MAEAEAKAAEAERVQAMMEKAIAEALEKQRIATEQ